MSTVLRRSYGALIGALCVILASFSLVSVAFASNEEEIALVEQEDIVTDTQDDGFLGPRPFAASVQERSEALTPTPGWQLSGTCEWLYDEMGCLTIRPVNNGPEGSLFCSGFADDGIFPLRYHNINPNHVKFEGTIYISGSLKEMFSDRPHLIDIEGLNNLRTSGATDMSSMFYGCSSLASLDLSSFDTSNVTDMSSMFYRCIGLASVDLSSFDTSNVTDMSFMFEDCDSLASLDLSSFDTSNVASMKNIFKYCFSLASLDLSSFNRSAITDMSSMFYDCNSLASVDLSSFDTSNVTDMSSMFYDCSSLASVDLSSFDTSNVTSMSGMFSGCGSLVSLDLSSFDTSNVADMSSMFYDCSSLASVDLSGFDTSNVADMSSMFYDCSSLASVDLSSFDTSNVTSMSGMFSGCGSLVSLDLSNFDTSNVAGTDGILGGCESLHEITIGESFTLQKGFPDYVWINVKGEQFFHESIPVGVADTYRPIPYSISIKAPEEGSTVLYVGDTLQLTADVSPSNIPPVSFYWFSSDPNVASVDDSGRVTAIKEGTTTIVVNSRRVKYAEVAITILSPGSNVVEVQSVVLDRTQISLVGQDTQTLVASVEPADATCKDVVWSSSDTSVARVDSRGSVTAVGKGGATITVQSVDGNRSASCNVTVFNPVTSIVCGGHTGSIFVGQDLDIRIEGFGELLGETDELTSISWSSSDSSIAEVHGSGMEGSIKGIDCGSCILQVKAVCNGKTLELSQEVNVIWDSIERITLSETSKTVEVGSGSFILEYGISNPFAAGRLDKIKWSDSSFADIEGSNGILTITPRQAGNEVIRLWCEGQAADAFFNLAITPKNVSISEDSDIEGYMSVTDAEVVDLIGSNRLCIMNSEEKDSSDLIRLAVGSAGGVSAMMDAYEIDLVDDAGNVVPWDQPDHTVTIFVKMSDPVKAALDEHDLAVHYIDIENNRAEPKNTWIEGDNIVFETTHFSTYAVTASQRIPDDPSGDNGKHDGESNGKNPGPNIVTSGSNPSQNGTRVSGEPMLNKLAQTGDMLGFGVFVIIELIMVAIGVALIARSRTLKFRRK